MVQKAAISRQWSSSFSFAQHLAKPPFETKNKQFTLVSDREKGDWTEIFKSGGGSISQPTTTTNNLLHQHHNNEIIMYIRQHPTQNPISLQRPQQSTNIACYSFFAHSNPSSIHRRHRHSVWYFLPHPVDTLPSGIYLQPSNHSLPSTFLWEATQLTLSQWRTDTDFWPKSPRLAERLCSTMAMASA